MNKLRFSAYRRRFRPFLAGIALFSACCVWGGSISAQTVGEGISNTSDSLGLGQSRFDSGYTPINLTKPDITPGMPFNIKPTMDSFITSQKGEGTFGGLLNRYDMTGFGKIFSMRANIPVSGVMPSRTLPTTVTDLGITNLTNEPRMYPPRISIDYAQYPTTDLNTPESRKNVDEAVKRVLEHYPLIAPEETLNIHFDEDRLILRGRIGSQRTVEALLVGLALEPGVQEVVSEVEMIPSAEPRPKDLLGYE